MAPGYNKFDAFCQQAGMNQSSNELIIRSTDVVTHDKDETCQETRNTGVSHLTQLLGGREGFLVVIKQMILYEDGPNNLFERFKLRDKSCDYYCCYCCVYG